MFGWLTDRPAPTRPQRQGIYSWRRNKKRKHVFVSIWGSTHLRTDISLLLPNLMCQLNVLLWTVSLLLFLFPFFNILPVSCSHRGKDTPPLTNPIVCPCQSLTLRLYLCLSTGMLLQDTYKCLTVVLMTVHLSCPFVSPLCPPGRPTPCWTSARL